MPRRKKTLVPKSGNNTLLMKGDSTEKSISLLSEGEFPALAVHTSSVEENFPLLQKSEYSLPEKKEEEFPPLVREVPIFLSREEKDAAILSRYSDKYLGICQQQKRAHEDMYCTYTGYYNDMLFR